MNNRRRLITPSATALCLAAGLAFAGAGAAQELERQNFLVELDGSFSEFIMRCTLIDGEVRERITRREYLPESYRILAEAVSCEITMLDYRGRLSGRLYAEDGSLIASADQNAVRPIVKLRSEGPWGAARGIRSSVGINPSIQPRTAPPSNPSVNPSTPAPAPGTRPSIGPTRPSR